MQIHELNEMSGAPAKSDVLAVDTGFVTDKLTVLNLMKGILSAGDLIPITAYPTTGGLFRVAGAITGKPSAASNYGALAIFDCGSYVIHLWLDHNSNLFYGYTSGGSVVAPSSWKRVFTFGGGNADGAIGAQNSLSAASNSNPSLKFYNGDRSKEIGNVYFINDDPRLKFRTFRKTDTSNYEDYNLPIPDTTGASVGYNILTSKSPVTIAQGGTGATGTSSATTLTPTNADSRIASHNIYLYQWGKICFLYVKVVCNFSANNFAAGTNLDFTLSGAPAPVQPVAGSCYYGTSALSTRFMQDKTVRYRNTGGALVNNGMDLITTFTYLTA